VLDVLASSVGVLRYPQPSKVAWAIASTYCSARAARHGVRDVDAIYGEILETAMVMHLIAFPQFLIEIPLPPSRAAIGH